MRGLFEGARTIKPGQKWLRELLKGAVFSRAQSDQGNTVIIVLMTGRRLMSLPDYGPYNEELGEYVNVVASDISKRIIHLNTELEHFWKRWEKEYLLELREVHRHGKYPPKEKHCDKIAVADMVLVPGDGKPQGFWKLAKVKV